MKWRVVLEHAPELLELSWATVAEVETGYIKDNRSTAVTTTPC